MFRYPDVPRKVKTTEDHPLKRVIKPEHIPQLRHYHNSVYNPEHPEQEERDYHHTRVKFSVIGEMQSKEFIYCSRAVAGLFRNKWKYYYEPEIKGVTAIIWPEILNNLRLRFGERIYCIKSPAVVLLNGTLFGGEHELRKFIEKQYSYHLDLNYPIISKQQLIDYMKSSGHPCVYMHINIESYDIGTLIFMLYEDTVPKTCENFMRLCRTKKGGYSGTPIHRIVNDAWIQCGGFGLKSVPMDCENFIIPHDRRGVLSMANAEKHVDCSTQFFVLLQPANWMDKKYVAFGQLIYGGETLKQIESIPTWFESPLVKVIISNSGVLDLDSSEIDLCGGTKEYLDQHVENLTDLEDYLLEMMMANLWLALEYKEIVAGMHNLGEEEQHAEQAEEQEQYESTKKTNKMKNVKRFFLRKKAPTIMPDYSKEESVINEDFDVEEYEEYGEELLSSSSHEEEEKPFRPYYIPFTDVPFPGETQSVYRLSKFLDGDYCLESDIQYGGLKFNNPDKISYLSDIMSLSTMGSEDTSDIVAYDSNDEKELQQYFKKTVDRYCLAGDVIKQIAKGVARTNLFDGDPSCRPDGMMGMKSCSGQSLDSRKSEKRGVSLLVPPEIEQNDEQRNKIKRRPTGFIRISDVRKIRIPTPTTIARLPSRESEASISLRKVHISSLLNKPKKSRTQSLAFQVADSEDTQLPPPDKISKLLQRMPEDFDESPTLKDYKPFEEKNQNIFLTSPPTDGVFHHIPERSERLLSHALGSDDTLKGIHSLRPLYSNESILYHYKKKQPHYMRSTSNMHFGQSSKYTMSVLQYQKMNSLRKEE